MGEVELREHIQSLIDHEREMREAHAAQLALALEKQALEYERRLDTLNHAHAQLKEMQAGFLPMAEFRMHLIDHNKSEERDIQWKRDAGRQLDGYRGALAAMSVILVLIGLGLRLLPI